MKEFIIYTDGSHFKSKFGSGRLGIGGILVDESDKIINEFSTEITAQYLKLYYGTADCSNPTMEMLAVLFALRKFRKELKGVKVITVKADYIGVREWMTRKWKINKPYIARIKTDIENEIKNLGIRINFEWVPSHQVGNTSDIKWNNYVDLLAKGEKRL